MKISNKILYILALILLFPAFLPNLGLLAFIDDEGIRSLVALEMELSGNWITPTLHGDYYYKKPPFFNWILGAWYQVTGQANEFYARLPTVAIMFAYAASIFGVLRPKYGTKFAFLSAFLLITCGRVIFWESMLSLIDMTFSWVMFMLFMVIYHFMEKQRYWPLFLLSYLLTAIGFMLKGLPAVVFQGLTLLMYFIYCGKIKKLFSLAHIIGGLVFIVLIGGYYAIYDQYNSLENVFATLFTESSKRTAANFSVGDTIGHLLAFPFELIYHFVPWTLLVLGFIRKDALALIRKDRFITFCLLTFGANIWIYWISPEVYPRYFLMLMPLIFISSLYVFDFHKKENTIIYRILDRLLLIICVVISLASWAPLFAESVQFIPNLIPKTLLGVILLSSATIGYYFKKEQRFLYLILFLLSFRIVFNFFVLPHRNANDYGDVVRKQAQHLGTTYQDQELYVYKDLLMEPALSFYMTNTRGQIIPRKYQDFQGDALYIVHPDTIPKLNFEKVDSLLQRHGNKPTYFIGKIK
ncbi:MAG: glycosyltransferase family 39 protein [Saprospiraceae bacterium]